MILVERDVALLLLLLGAPRELDRSLALAVAGLGLRTVARRRLGPLVDLLCERRLARIVGGRGLVDLRGLGRDDRQGAADVLGFGENPQIGGFDLGIQRGGLRA